MNPRIWGIIGGVALVLALLSPFVLGSSKKVERLFEDAEKLQQRANYEEAIVKYRDALSASKKFGANTEVIDEDFTTLANYKIAQCYYELARQSGDVNYYATALGYVKAVFPKASVVKHQEALTYLWAQILYKTGQFELAEAKFREFIANFPNSFYIADAEDAIARMNAEGEPLVPESDENAYPEPVEPVAQALLRGAQALLDAEDYEGAHREFDSLATDEKFRDRREIQAEAMFKTAYSLGKLGKNVEALAHYTAFIARFPESPYVTEAYVNKGEIYAAQRDYINARENYESAMYATENLERRAELYDIYHQTYLVPMRARMEERALEDELADKASEKYARLIKANRLWGERQFLEAAKEYEAFAADKPADTEVPYAIYQSGSCYYLAAFEKAEPFGKAVTVFQKLIDAYRESDYAIKAYHGMAVAYRDWAQEHGDNSKWWLAIKTVEEANEKYADSTDEVVREILGRMKPIKDSALAYLGTVAKSKAQVAIDEAEKTVERANRLNAQKHAATLMQEATTLLTHAKEAHRAANYDYAFDLAEQASEQARKATDKARTAESRQSVYVLKKIRVDEGYEALEKGALVTAEKRARQSLKIDRNYRAAHQLLNAIKQTYYGEGLACLDENRYSQAITAFENAARIDPSFAKALCNLGVIYIEQHQESMAIAPLKKAIEANPKFKEARFNLGIVYLRLGQFELARDAAGIVLELCDTSRKAPVCEAAEVLLDSIAE